MRAIYFAFILFLQGCANMKQLAHEEHAQIYCVGSATIIPLLGPIAQTRCVIFWGAPW